MRYFFYINSTSASLLKSMLFFWSESVNPVVPTYMFSAAFLDVDL